MLNLSYETVTHIFFANNYIPKWFCECSKWNFRDSLISSVNETVPAMKNVQVWKLFQDKVDTVLCGDPKKVDLWFKY